MNIDPASSLIAKNALDSASSEMKLSQLKQSSVDFEAMLLNQMFDAMQKTLDQKGLIGGGLSGSIFSSFMIDAVSKEMASSQSVGLSKQLYQQVLRHEPKLEKLDEKTSESDQKTGLKMGVDVPLELHRRGLDQFQILPNQPFVKAATEPAKNADNNNKAQL